MTNNMDIFLAYAQIVIAIVLIAAVLLQQRSSSLGGAFGGAGETFHTKRGAEHFLYLSTVALSAGLFVATLLRAIL